jgi:hypothetical protein
MALTSPAIVASANDPRSQIVSLADELEHEGLPALIAIGATTAPSRSCSPSRNGRSMKEVVDAKIRLALSRRGSCAIGFHLGVCALSSGSDYSITSPFF